MGGALVVRTAAAVPDRIGAGASFHGGGLVTDKPDSPHLLAPKIKARMYFGVASNDDAAAAGREGQAEGSVRRGEGAGGSRGLSRRSTAGACPTCRPRPAQPIYDKADAERAWGKLLALYRTALG